MTLTMWIERARLRLGAAIIGRRLLGAPMRQTLVAQRARDCITPDGSVILANCKPLADALYKPIDGTWTLAVTLNALVPLPTAERAET